jgi:acyl carrier protein
VNDVGPNDNFFELGGTSLLAMKIIGELERRWNIQIPFICLFDAESLEAFAAEVRALLGESEERHEISADESGNQAGLSVRR